MKPSRSTPRKFGNRPERGFDSGKEARKYDELLALKCATEARHRVVEIRRQVRYELIPVQRELAHVVERACTYVADFVVLYADGRREVIDVKSEVTRRLPAYVIKRKLMLWRHGVRVREE